MWVYHSPVGPLYIKRTDHAFGLWFDDICYGIYSSAYSAADDVFTFSTGCNEWDSLCNRILDHPTDLGEWEQC